MGKSVGPTRSGLLGIEEMRLDKETEWNEVGFVSLMEDLPGRKSLGDYVFERLKEAIINGELAPGSRIIENRLANALGISRTPIREAIHKLDRAGFLRRLSQGGFTVVSLTRDDIEEAFGIRSIPSLLFCPADGQPQMAQGALPKETLKQVIDDILLNKKVVQN